MFPKLEIEGEKDGIVAVGILTGITLRGVVIETAESGQRVVLDSTHGLRGIDSSGNVLTQITTGGQLALKTAATGARIEMDATNGLRGIDSSGNPQSQIDVNGLFKAFAIRDMTFDNMLELGGESGVFEFSNSGSVPGLIISVASDPVRIYPDGQVMFNASILLSGYQSTDSVIIAARYGTTELARFNSKGQTIQNVGSEPSAPAAGGILYVYGGALKYISAGGTRTVVAPN
jgi:hypothetical protein